MREDDLPTALLIEAQIRRAAREGVVITRLRKGGDGACALCLKINLLDGTTCVYSQVNEGAARGWFAPLGEAPLPESEADAYLQSQGAFDPDLWIVEIEDRKGRNWFEA